MLIYLIFFKGLFIMQISVYRKKISSFLVLLTMTLLLYIYNFQLIYAAPASQIHYYSFDENTWTVLWDVYGSQWTITNGAWSPGLINSAIDFNNTNISLWNMDITWNGLTISAWIKPDTFGIPDARIISKTTSSSGADHYWMISTMDEGGKYYPRFRLKSDQETVTLVWNNVELQAWVWQQITATYDQTTMRIYVNGVEAGSSTWANWPVAQSSAVPVSIWANPDGSRTFDGAIDELKIYNEALSAAEILTDYNDDIATSWYTPPAIAPILSNGAPSGEQSSGTTNVILSVSTDENAFCKYSTTANIAYGLMTNSFSTTWAQSHTVSVWWLTDGNLYRYYVRCIDGDSNENISDYLINFSVANLVEPTGGNILFEDDFDGHNEWTPTWSECGWFWAEKCPDDDIPLGWTWYRHTDQWNPSTWYPSHNYGQRISSDEFRWASWKAWIKSSESDHSIGESNYYSDAILMKVLEEDYDEIHTSFWIKFPAEWEWVSPWNGELKLTRMGHVDSGTGVNVFQLWGAGNTGPMYLLQLKNSTQWGWRGHHEPRCDNQEDNYYCDNEIWYDPVFVCPEGMTCTGEIDYTPAGNPTFKETMWDGSWHKLELYVKNNSTPGIADGEFSMWIDGVEQYSRSDAQWRYAWSPADLGFNFVSIGWNWNNFFSDPSNNKELSYAIDDFVAYTPIDSSHPLWDESPKDGRLPINYVIGSGALPSDTTAPVLSNGGPTGELSSGTTNTTLSVSTDETATCKYSPTANATYAWMSDTFIVISSTSHSVNIAGLTNGNSYTYYVRCEDESSNENTSDYTISFSVASTPISSGGNILFEDNFDDHPDWYPSPTSTVCTGAGVTGICDDDVPQDWTFYRNSDDNWHPDNGYSTKKAGQRISGDVKRGTEGKSWIKTSESNHTSDEANYYSDSILMKSLDQEYDEVYFSAWVLMQPGWQWQAGTKQLKLFRLWHFDGPSGSVDPFKLGSAGVNGPLYIFDLNNSSTYGWTSSHAPRCDPQESGYLSCGGPSYYNKWTTTDYFTCLDGEPCTGFTTSVDGVTHPTFEENFGDGEWHHIELRVKMNSTPGVEDGIFQFWLDGLLEHSVTDMPFRQVGSPEGTGWNFISIGGNWNNWYSDISNQDEEWYAVDDVVTYTPIDSSHPLWDASPKDGRLPESYVIGTSNSGSTDTTAPILSNGTPTGELSLGTTNTTLSVSTDETATCKYSSTVNTTYAWMSNVFTITNSTSHSVNITWLTDGNSYTYYVRCEDGSSNENTSDYTISFSVASTPISSGGNILFEDNFDDHPDWYVADGSEECDGIAACDSTIPEGWNYLRNTEYWHPDNGFPTKKPGQSITNEQFRWASGKSWIKYQESSKAVWEQAWGDDTMLIKSLSGSYDEINMSFWVKVDPDWQWADAFFKLARIYNFDGPDGVNSPWNFFSNGDSAPIFLLDIKSSPTYGYRSVAALRCDPQESEYYCGAYPDTYDSPWGGTNASTTFTDPFDDGGWHHLEIKVWMNSALWVADGTAQYWLDGVEEFSLSDIPWRSAWSSLSDKFNTFWIGWNTYNWFSDPSNQAEQWYAIDDVVVYTPIDSSHPLWDESPKDGRLPADYVIGEPTSTGSSDVTAPVLLYSDLESWPKSGWSTSESDKWVAVTVWWKNFWSSRGSSYISVGWVDLTSDSDYEQWWDAWPTPQQQRITFYLNSSMWVWDLDIKLHIGGQESNTLPFTIRDGDIYFVNSTDTFWDGSFTSPFSYKQASGWSWYLENIQPGDILYFRGGTYSEKTNGWNSILWIRTSEISGTQGNPIALISYPWELANFTYPTYSNSFQNGVFFENNYMVMSWFAFDTPYASVRLAGDYHRFIWNDVQWLKEYFGQWAGHINVWNNSTHLWNGNIVLGNAIHGARSANRFDHGIYIAWCADTEGNSLWWNYIYDNDYGRWPEITVNHQQNRCLSTQVVKSHFIFNNIISCDYQRATALNVYDLSYDPGEVIPEPTYVYNNLILNCGTYDAADSYHTWYAPTSKHNSINWAGYFYNNTFYNSGYIWFSTSAGTTFDTKFDNNIVHMTSDFPGPTGNHYMSIWEASTVNLSNNLYYGIGNYDSCTDCIADVNNVDNLDPLFVNTSSDNLNIESWSPAVDSWKNSLVFDKALPSFAPIARDLNGIMRQGTYDIWAYEYVDGTIVVVDTTAPILSNGTPTGEQASGTTNTTLSVSTDENAFCKYSTTADTAYGSMINTFATTWSQSHSVSIWGLTNGVSYTYYVRCIDGSSNENNLDFVINFNVTDSITSSSWSTFPLLTLDNISYQGAFRLPSGNFWVGDYANASFSYGAIWFNADNNSLFVAGHEYGKSIAEFSIPELVNSTDITALNTAEAPLQNFTNVLDKAVHKVNGQSRINGIYAENGHLLVNHYDFYDQSPYSSTNTLILRDSNNLATSEVDGYFTMEGQSYAAGWISPTPVEWQSALGGTHIGGFTNSTARALIYSTSVGPAAFAFNATDVLDNSASISDIPTTELLKYTLPNGLVPLEDLYNSSGTNDLWTHASEGSFGMIVPWTSTYLVLWMSGGHESGMSYGVSPHTGIQGHYIIDEYDTYPYYWMYDVNDLVDVKNGIMNAYDVTPYDVGIFDAPFQISKVNQISGGTFDPVSGTLFVSIYKADYNQATGTNPPVIAAYKFSTGSTTSTDITVPVLSNGTPSGEQAWGTTNINLSLDTDENATCKYSTVANTVFTSMTNTFTTTWITSHSTNVTWLTDGNSYTYYVRCIDWSSNETTTDYTLNFSVANTPDTTAPVLSNGTPSGEQASGTTNVNLTLDTVENATCRYATSANTAYSSMINTFATTWNTSHTTNITWLTDATSYTYYVRCMDGSSNENTADYTLNFSVANTPDTAAPILSNGTPSGEQAAGTTNITLSISTDEDAFCKYSTTASVAYGSMINNFATTWSQTHSVSIWGLTDATSHTYYVRCIDGSSNATTADYTLNFSVAVTPDTTAPVLSNGTPSGEQASGTTNVNLTLDTDENATCKYWINSNTTYAWIGNTFTTTWNTTHSTNITWLIDGISYTYYVRCIDSVSNVNTTDYTLNFSVANTPDTTAPILSNGTPSGEQASGTSNVNLILDTDENATCRYSPNANTSYWAMWNTFTTTWNTNHTTNITWLTDGTSHTYYIRCMDGNSNATTTDYTLNFSVANTPDTWAPFLSNGLPNWEQASGTTNVNLTLDTNEASTCKYSTVVNTTYASMTDTFTTTWNTSHSTNVTWLTDGTSYTYYVRCIDGSNNETTTDYTLNFSVANVVDTTVPILSNGLPNGEQSAGTTNVNLTLDTNEASTCKYSTVVNTTYASMTDTFTTGTWGLNHTANVTWLTNGISYAYYVRCIDGSSNENTIDYAMNFSVATLIDVTAPVLSNGLPNGEQTAGTTNVNLTLDTNEISTCKYSTTVNTTYTSMTDLFTTATWGLNHTANLTWLTDSTSYTYYVRCMDTDSNENTSDYTINFSVATASTSGWWSSSWGWGGWWGGWGWWSYIPTCKDEQLTCKLIPWSTTTYKWYVQEEVSCKYGKLWSICSEEDVIDLNSGWTWTGTTTDTTWWWSVKKYHSEMTILQLIEKRVDKVIEQKEKDNDEKVIEYRNTFIKDVENYILARQAKQNTREHKVKILATFKLFAKELRKENNVTSWWTTETWTASSVTTHLSDNDIVNKLWARLDALIVKYKKEKSIKVLFFKTKLLKNIDSYILTKKNKEKGINYRIKMKILKSNIEKTYLIFLKSLKS